MPDTETKTLVGQCVEITEKNGWTAFSVDVGTQWPVKLSTKLAAIIDAGRAVGGDVATWTYKESQGGENPNKPGTFFTNRYLDKVEVGEHAPDPAPSGGNAPVETKASEPVDWDAKERRDYRSRAWAQTLGAFTHTIKVDEDPKEVFKRLLPFQMLVYSDVVRDLAYDDDDNDDIPF